jgi:hypothetical protein
VQPHQATRCTEPRAEQAAFDPALRTCCIALARLMAALGVGGFPYVGVFMPETLSPVFSYQGDLDASALLVWLPRSPIQCADEAHAPSEGA